MNAKPSARRPDSFHALGRGQRLRACVPVIVATAALAALQLACTLPVQAATGTATPAPARTRVAYPGAEPSLQQRNADAMRCLRQGHFAAAYGRFAELADAGHAPAAHMALALLRNGLSQFGSEWSATPGQLRRWSALAQQDLRAEGARISDHERGE